jgi:hypothetical protein
MIFHPEDFLTAPSWHRSFFASTSIQKQVHYEIFVAHGQALPAPFPPQWGVHDHLCSSWNHSSPRHQEHHR